MIKTMCLVAAAALSLVAGSARAEPIKSTFTLVGQTFNFTVPDGFCPLDDQTRPLADTLAAADTQNQTDLSYFECSLSKTGGAPKRYGIIKTPKGSLLGVLPPRAELLKQFAAAISDGSLAAAMKKTDFNGAASKALKDATGIENKIAGEPKIIEADDKAAYLVGLINISNATANNTVALTAAVTEVKGRMFFIYFYKTDSSFADLAPGLAEVKRQVAGFIADNGG